MNDQNVRRDNTLTLKKFPKNSIETKGLKKTMKKEELVELINPYAEFDIVPKDGFVNGSC